MRKAILKWVSCCFQAINRMMVKCHLIKPIVVVGVDGGISSQMIAYLRGQYFAQVGIPVYYNLSWFKNCGKDVYGKFDLLSYQLY